MIRILILMLGAILTLAGCGGESDGLQYGKPKVTVTKLADGETVRVQVGGDTHLFLVIARTPSKNCKTIEVITSKFQVTYLVGLLNRMMLIMMSPPLLLVPKTLENILEFAVI